jgi:hypothetical protein
MFRGRAGARHPFIALGDAIREIADEHAAAQRGA